MSSVNTEVNLNWRPVRSVDGLMPEPDDMRLRIRESKRRELLRLGEPGF